MPGMAQSEISRSNAPAPRCSIRSRPTRPLGASVTVQPAEARPHRSDR